MATYDDGQQIDYAWGDFHQYDPWDSRALYESTSDHRYTPVSFCWSTLAKRSGLRENCSGSSPSRPLGHVEVGDMSMKRVVTWLADARKTELVPAVPALSMEGRSMSPDAESLVVFAVLEGPAEEVVYAAHPTEARRQDYQAPSSGGSRRVTDDLLTDDDVLQEIGSALLQEDGTYRIELKLVPPSRSLVLAPVGYGSR